MDLAPTSVKCGWKNSATRKTVKPVFFFSLLLKSCFLIYVYNLSILFYTQVSTQWAGKKQVSQKGLWPSFCVRVHYEYFHWQLMVIIDQLKVSVSTTFALICHFLLYSVPHRTVICSHNCVPRGKTLELQDNSLVKEILYLYLMVLYLMLISYVSTKSFNCADRYIAW